MLVVLNADIIGEIEHNPVLRGWYAYYKYSHWTTFPGMNK